MCQTCYERGYNDYPKWVGSAPHPEYYKKGFDTHQSETGEAGHYAEAVDFCETCYNRGYEDGLRDYWAPPTTPNYGHKESYKEGFNSVKAKREEKERREEEYQQQRQRQQQTSRPIFSKNDDETSVLSKLFAYAIAGAAIVIAVIWVVSLVLTLSLINIATIALIGGLAMRKRSKFLYPISVLGAIYIVFDFNKGWATKALAENVSFLKGAIPFFFYLNIAAGLVAAYFLIRNYLNEKNAPAEGESEFSKRNLIVMGCLALLGGLTIGGQKYFDAVSTHTALSVGSTVSTIPTQGQPTTKLVAQDLEERERERTMTNAMAQSELQEDDAHPGSVGRTHAGEEAILSDFNSNTAAKTVNVKRAYFYDFVQGNFEKRTPELFVIHGDKVAIINSQNGYVNVKFSTKNGAIVTGWLLETDLSASSLGRFPQASERLLSLNDISGLNKDDLKVMRNEIFARHGYIFKTDDMEKYFVVQSWYRGQYSDVSTMLTDIEKQNVQFIKSHE